LRYWESRTRFQVGLLSSEISADDVKPLARRQAVLTLTRNKSEIENTVMEIAGQIFVKIIL